MQANCVYFLLLRRQAQQLQIAQHRVREVRQHLLEDRQVVADLVRLHDEAYKDLLDDRRVRGDQALDKPQLRLLILRRVEDVLELRLKA